MVRDFSSCHCLTIALGNTLCSVYWLKLEAEADRLLPYSSAVSIVWSFKDCFLSGMVWYSLVDGFNRFG
jgi:hypothetical protein